MKTKEVITQIVAANIKNEIQKTKVKSIFLHAA